MSENQSAGFDLKPVMVVLAICAPLFIVAALMVMLIFGFRGAQPNESGTVTQKASDVTKPATVKLINQLEAAVKPAQALKRDKAGFTQGKNNIDVFMNGIKDNSQLSDSEKQRIFDLAGTIRNNYEWLEKQADSPQINLQTALEGKMNEIESKGKEISTILNSKKNPGGIVQNPGVDTCKSLTTNPKVIFDKPNDREGFKTGKIKVTRRDEGHYGELINVNTKICGLAKTLIDNGFSSVKFMSVVGTHNYYVVVNGKNTGRVSAHATGNGADIYTVSWGASKQADIMRWIVEHQSELKAAGLWPKQLIGGFDSSSKYCIYNNINTDTTCVDNYKSSLPGHRDHLHLGY